MNNLYLYDCVGLIRPHPTSEQEESIHSAMKKLMEVSKQMNVKFLLVDSDYLQKTGKIRYI